MSFAETVLLGAIAGFTIYLGLPIGRINRVDDRLRVALAMFSVGILAFIFMDVTTHGQEIIGNALGSFKAHKTGFPHVLGLFALLAVGFTVGTAGIAVIERRLRPKNASRPRIAGGESATAFSPAADRRVPERGGRRPAHRAAHRDDDRCRDRPPQLRRGTRDRGVRQNQARSALRRC